MGKIFCIMGKSSSGKDTLYRRILKDKSLGLSSVVSYTTRPARFGEEDGKEYFFVDEKRLEELQAAGRVIEMRAYDTAHGIWKYFTVDDGQIHLTQQSYLMIATLEAYTKVKDYFGASVVVPIYLEVEDGTRLQRALERENLQIEPKYEELCRRFLADAKDFAEEKLQAAGIDKRFSNDCLERAYQDVQAYIRFHKTERSDICSP